MKYAAILALAFLLLCMSMPIAANEINDLTLLFTTDIHANAVQHMSWIGGHGQRAGGYARLKSALDANAVADRTLILDSGDFSMGTLYQNFTVSDALELTVMDRLGYDAVALGNHDFDPGEDALAAMLDLYRAKGGNMRILCANLALRGGSASPDANPLDAHGVDNYAVFERNGLKIGVFALMGKEAVQYTPVETMGFDDAIKTAKAIVRRLREEEHVDLIVLLSHAGIDPGGDYAEDADIARAVDGIDVILSGHKHFPTPEIIRANDTVIVCAGTALDYLGRLDLRQSGDGWDADFRLIPLTDEWPEDDAICDMIAPYTRRIRSEYLTAYGVDRALDDVFAYSPYDFPSVDDMYKRVDNYALGTLITDAYLYAARQAGVADAQIGAAPVGVMRGTLFAGPLAVMDAYNALSYGVSPIDGSSASPMVSVYLTGRELYDICETSISLSEILSSAQIMFSGLRYTYSPLRPLLNRVYLVETYNPESGAYVPVARDDTTLYNLVCSWTAMQSIALVKKNSYGLLSIEPRDAQGVVLATPESQMSRILYTDDGAEMKEWYTLYQYIGQMDKNDQGLPEIDMRYAQPTEFVRKTAPSVATFFVNPNKAAWIQYGAAAAICAAVLYTIMRIKKSRRNARGRKKRGASDDRTS